jgi:NADH dehydrogenase/NADH:ubiquinone oxidoreductase subunit G
LVGGRRDWSTIAAGVSLVVAWQARRIQGRAADFSNCLEAARELRDAMRRVHDAPDAAKVKFEFTELLNLLEALALLYNDGKIAASTKKFTGNFLDEVLAWIRADASMKQRMQETETSPTTYQELKLFEKNRPQESRQLTKAYAKKRGLR